MATISFNFCLRHTIFRYFSPAKRIFCFFFVIQTRILNADRSRKNPSDISFIMIILTLYHTHILHLHVYECDLNASRSWSHFALVTPLPICLLVQIEMSCSHRKKAFIYIWINEFRSCFFLRSIFTISKRDDNKVSRNSSTENYSEIGSVMCAQMHRCKLHLRWKMCILKTRE